MHGRLLLLMILLGIPMQPVARAAEVVVIRNLASGLVCGASESERRVCFQTEEIPVTGEGRCVFAGQDRPCTWYGFSFDYELQQEGVTLNCAWSSSDPARVGNPSAEIATGVNKGTYELKLARRDRAFFNPQYASLPNASQAKAKVTRIKQACSYEGKQLFEVSFTVRYPER